jgi:hypothetical protein
MKNFKISPVFIVAVAILCSFSLHSYAQVFGIKGNGNIVQQGRDLSGFSKIEILGSADVIIRQDNQTTVEVHADENLMDNLITEVKNDRLVIRTEGSIRSYKKFEVHVTMVRLDGVSIAGSGDVRSAGTISGSDLDISINGSGDVDMELDYKNLSTSINGSGDVNVSGVTGDFDLAVMGSGDFSATDLRLDNCTIKVMGSGDVKLFGKAVSVNVEVAASGDINLHNLPADDVEVQSYGSGDVIVTVAGDLKVRLMGSGDLTYSGEPLSVDVSSLGSGSAYKR